MSRTHYFDLFDDFGAVFFVNLLNNIVLVELKSLSPGGVEGVNGQNLVFVRSWNEIKFGFRRKVFGSETAKFLHDFDRLEGGSKAVFAGGLRDKALE